MSRPPSGPGARGAQDADPLPVRAPAARGGLMEFCFMNRYEDQRTSRKRDRPPASTSWRKSRSICSTLRTQAVTEKLEDPSQLGKTRKREIARVKTVLRQRELEAARK
jgi:ribosomal protein L29